ncbi:hypothetical protein CYMTET_25367, partial [Cymbomonas tetramitiformis]
METRGGMQGRMLHLLANSGIIGVIVEYGLYDAMCSSAAAELLLELAQRGSDRHRRKLMQWLPWIECATTHQDTAVFASSVCNLLSSAPGSKGFSPASLLPPSSGTSWAGLQPQLRALFDRGAARRQEGARMLRAALWPGCGGEVHGGCMLARLEAWTDPFGGLLGESAQEFAHLHPVRAACFPARCYATRAAVSATCFPCSQCTPGAILSSGAAPFAACIEHGAPRAMTAVTALQGSRFDTAHHDRPSFRRSCRRGDVPSHKLQLIHQHAAQKRVEHLCGLRGCGQVA